MEGKVIDLSKTVCSVDLAKNLKEAGVKQESMWFWHNAYHGEPDNKWRLLKKNDISFWMGYACSAFTDEELIHMIPSSLSSSNIENTGDLELEAFIGRKEIAFVSYDDPYDPVEVINFSYKDTDKFVDGLAKALLWVIDFKKKDE